jgi:hypothetical protein
LEHPKNRIILKSNKYLNVNFIMVCFICSSNLHTTGVCAKTCFQKCFVKNSYSQMILKRLGRQ